MRKVFRLQTKAAKAGHLDDREFHHTLISSFKSTIAKLEVMPATPERDREIAVTRQSLEITLRHSPRDVRAVARAATNSIWDALTTRQP